MSILTSNMKVTKIVQNTLYAHFEGFWSPSYVTSKLTSVCVNLIMSMYFSVNLLHSLCGQMGIMVNSEDRNGAHG